MNPRDELIRRAMLHARHGYAVGGKPGESAMAKAEASRGVSSGNYGGQTARAEAGSSSGGGGGGNAANNVGGIRDGGFGGSDMGQQRSNTAAKGDFGFAGQPSTNLSAKGDFLGSGATDLSNYVAPSPSIGELAYNRALAESFDPTNPGMFSMPNLTGTNIPAVAYSGVNVNKPSTVDFGTAIATYGGSLPVSRPKTISDYMQSGTSTPPSYGPITQQVQTAGKGDFLGVPTNRLAKAGSFIGFGTPQPPELSMDDIVAGLQPQEPTSRPVMMNGEFISSMPSLSRLTGMKSPSALALQMGNPTFNTGPRAQMAATPATAPLAGTPRSIVPSGYYNPVDPFADMMDTASYAAPSFEMYGRGTPPQAAPVSTGVSPAQTAFGVDDFRAPPSAQQFTATPSVGNVVANQSSVSPTADMPAPMNYVPMVPRPTTPPPANANFFQSVANAMLPENLFPMALYTQPTPPGQYLTLAPEDRGLFSGYMAEPFRIDRDIGVATMPTTGMPNPNANVITTASGRQMAFNPALGRYEYVSKFRGSLDDRPGGDNREQNRERIQSRQNNKLLGLGYTQAEIDAMSPEKIKEVLAGNVAKAANGGRMGYAQGGKGRNRGESSSSSKSSSAASTFYSGPDRLPDLSAYQPSTLPTYTLPQASPMISNFVNSMPQQSSMPMMAPPMNIGMPQQRPQYSPEQGYFNPFENLFGYNQYLSNMGRPMNSGGSVNGSNDSISNAMRIIRG